MPLIHRIRTSLLLGVGAALLLPSLAHAQSLRGSRASIDRMYRHAKAERFSFLETPSAVRRFVASGLLVPLRSGASYEVHRVGFPYVRPTTRTFVERLAVQYRAACGERLVVTSAVRPESRQPANSADRSVHPTGMAVDLRKPTSGRCLRWLRSTLLDLERARVIEATEERWPPHFHVAVYPTQYGRYASSRTKASTRRSSAAVAQSAPRKSTVAQAANAAPAKAAAAQAATYVVRPGDSLWRIARTHDTTVDAIASANDLDGHEIRAGQALQIPVSR